MWYVLRDCESLTRASQSEFEHNRGEIFGVLTFANRFFGRSTSRISGGIRFYGGNYFDIPEMSNYLSVISVDDWFVKFGSNTSIKKAIGQLVGYEIINRLDKHEVSWLFLE